MSKGTEIETRRRIQAKAEVIYQKLKTVVYAALVCGLTHEQIMAVISGRGSTR